MNSINIPDTILDRALEENNNQRWPCVLVLDGSLSMSDDPVNQLNRGLQTLEQELKKDSTAGLIEASETQQVNERSDLFPRWSSRGLIEARRWRAAAGKRRRRTACARPSKDQVDEDLLGLIF
jgi:hypothetical protein